MGITLPNCMGIIINHDKDPSNTISIMESKRAFFVAHLNVHETSFETGNTSARCWKMNNCAIPKTFLNLKSSAPIFVATKTKRKNSEHPIGRQKAKS